jgi:hypothetical protein
MPLARARGAPLLVRRDRVALSRVLEEELFRSADVLSEGECRAGADGSECYYGSTMITLDLDPVRRSWRGRFDEAARQHFAAVVRGSARVHLRAMRTACAEVARRVSDRPLGTAQVDIRVRLDGEHLYLDVDLEVPLGVSSSSSGR